jgi:hypothetical protein
MAVAEHQPQPALLAALQDQQELFNMPVALARLILVARVAAARLVLMALVILAHPQREEVEITV